MKKFIAIVKALIVTKKVINILGKEKAKVICDEKSSDIAKMILDGKSVNEIVENICK